MKHQLLSCLAAAALAGGAAHAATPQAEYLDRGVVAVGTSEGVFVSWRSLTTDAANTTFDVYRDGTKVNDAPLSTKTNFVDPAGQAGATYEVRASNTSVAPTGTAKAWSDPYMKVHLDRPASGSVDGHTYTYSPDDCSVGDVDGDGIYEIFVKWVPSDAKDSASSGFTGPTIIDCYKLDGTKLWRVDLGHNIRSGNHYTQFMVYDFDGDGSAEMICKTAPGTKDGKGNWVLMGNDKETDDYRIYDVGSRKAAARGHVLGGAEYLTCFSGKTGEALSTIAYKPGYDYVSEDTWGDNYCNRSDRYLGGVAYLDGLHPSVIMARGYYRCAFVWAVDFKNGKLQEVWFHESKEKNKGLWGEGAHSLTVGDVDADGKDEIVYGAASLDHDGTLLYRTGGAHGDALHLARMIPGREGYQVFMPHEEKGSDFPFDTEMRDARTGEIIYMKGQSGNDIGRGLAANVSPNYPGYEYWAASDASVYSQGVAIANNRPSINFRIYWDGDLLDECMDGTSVTKPAADFSKINTLMDFSKYSNAASCNGTKATPNLQADLFGDWREEIILHDGSTQSDLLIFTTTTPTAYKIPTLMQDHHYRMAVAWQNTAYNQPPHPSFSPEDTYDTQAAVLLSSGAASQMVVLGEAMEPVTLKVRNAQSLAIAGELPAGLAWSFDETTKAGTLSGTPAAEGDYVVTVTTVGATEGDEATLQIKLKVNHVVVLKPLAYFSFDNPGTTVTNHINGQAVATGEAPEAIQGKKGNAALFNGSNHYTQEAYDAIQLGSRDFTIEMWMKSADDAAYIFHKGSHAANATTGATGHWVGLELKNAVLYFAIDDDVTKSQTYFKEADKYFDNEWHHVVLVRDTYAKQLLIYMDGELKGSAADNTGAINDNNELLVLGNVGVSYNNNFTGALDEFTIYEGAMSAEKVAERYATTGKELAYFPFDTVGETTPNLTYGEAAATNGTPAHVSGIKGGAVSFNDGAHYKQEAYDAIQMGENDFTITCWIKSTDTDGYLYFKGSHAANASTGTTGHWIGLERHSSGALTFAIDDNVNKSDTKLADANYVFDGKWHHIACVRNFADKTNTLYVDGVEKAVNSAVKTGAIADNNEPLLIGISDEAARPYDGVMDEFVICPRALTADEVKADYNVLAESNLQEVIATTENSVYTVVDAFSGMRIRTAAGSAAATITNGLAHGVYVLVIETPGAEMETYKFVK